MFQKFLHLPCRCRFKRSLEVWCFFDVRLREIDCKLERDGRQTVMIAENCPAHPVIAENCPAHPDIPILKATELQVLP